MATISELARDVDKAVLQTVEASIIRGQIDRTLQIQLEKVAPLKDWLKVLTVQALEYAQELEATGMDRITARQIATEGVVPEPEEVNNWELAAGLDDQNEVLMRWLQDGRKAQPGDPETGSKAGS
jgi:phosphoribosylformimino-5-aminoimidazole carboxamide ribonucleotide (ProFAR) isomerase